MGQFHSIRVEKINKQSNNILLKLFLNYFRDPSPNENSEALQGVPKFLPYDDKNKHFMAINDEWELRKDYTNVRHNNA